MPLARIITNAVEDSLELSVQLRARGFQVETVAPGTVPATAADLEVRLDECDSADVTSRVPESDSGENVWVYVAPGAIDDRARPMRIISLVAPIQQIHPSPATEKSKLATVLPFVHPEDDPILAEIEADVILSELQEGTSQQAAELPSRAGAVAPVRDRVERLSSSDVNRSALHDTSRASETTRESSPSAIKVPTSLRDSESWIPRVPERPSLPLRSVQTVSLRKPSPAVFRINLHIGPSFWSKAWASSALIVLVGLLALIMGTRPPLPATASQPLPIRSQSVVSAFEHLAKPVPPPAAVKQTAEPPAPSVVRQAAQVSKAEAPTHPQHARSSHTDDIIAQDTVIFYDHSHRSPASKAVPPPPPRRYSDQN